MGSAQTITQTHEPHGGHSRTPYLFLAIRCDAPLEPGARIALHEFDEVTIGRAASLGGDPRTEQGARVLRLGVPDARMSAAHARLQNVLGSWMIKDDGSKNGTFVDGARIATAQLRDGTVFELGHSCFVFRQGLPPADPVFLEARELRPAAHGMATLSPSFAAELARAVSFARSPVPVLLQGESGTGKELIARAIHEISKRAGPFVPVNCGAIPGELVEAELFGSRKGAFTSSVEDRPGFVRTSDGGTLLLDEIGDLPIAAQTALLRVLQEEEVVPVGTTRPIKVDLRVVSATHRDLKARVAEEKFRADLLARLDGAVIALPPLRERREDFGLLVAALLRKLAREQAPAVTFTSEAMQAMLRYDWPLNVRELEKCLASALALARDGRIELAHLPPAVRAPPPKKAVEAPALRAEDRQLRDNLVAIMRETHGNVTATAKQMNKARVQVQRWLRRFGIDPASFR